MTSIPLGALLGALTADALFPEPRRQPQAPPPPTRKPRALRDARKRQKASRRKNRRG